MKTKTNLISLLSLSLVSLPASAGLSSKATKTAILGVTAGVGGYYLSKLAYAKYKASCSVAGSCNQAFAMIAAGSLAYAIAAKKNSRKVAKTGRQVTDTDNAKPISRLPANQEATHTFDPDGSGPLPEIPVVKDEDGNINNAETGERIGQLGEKAFEKRYPDYSFDPLPPSSETPVAREEATHTFDPDGSGPLPEIPVVKDEDGNINNAETGERIGQLGEKAFEKRYPDYSLEGSEAITLTSGKISINHDTKFGWFVAAGRLSSYKKGGSLSIDPIPDQFKAIYTQHSETHIWVKAGTTPLATLEVDGVSYPLRSTHIEKSTPTYWGDLNYNRYQTLYPHPPKFTAVGQTRQIRILDANGNVLLGSLASP